MGGGRVIEVASEEEWNSHLSAGGSFGGKAVVVDFSATWCGPCQVIGPVFEALSTKYPSVTFLKVDVDQLQDVAAACGVRAMPTFQGFLNGNKIAEAVGADPKKLEAMIVEVASKVVASAGVKLGGAGPSASAGDDSADDRRARMAAAAEARLKALQG